jgi:Ca2+-binding EF-hand superfamily protein
MLSDRTEQKLAELLFSLITGEKEVEEARFSLCRNRDFIPSSAFSRLDRIGMGSFSSSDLLAYLSKNQISCSRELAYSIIRQYDLNSDGRLCFAEFSHLVFPSILPCLPCPPDSRHSTLSLEAEYMFLQLLDLEVRLQRRLETIRKELVDRSDFNLMEGFRSLDRRIVTRVDMNAVWVFLRRHGFYCVEMDMQHLMNRIDREKDGVVSYIEFVEAVLPGEPYVANRSPERRSKNSSPLKKPYGSRDAYQENLRYSNGVHY